MWFYNFWFRIAKIKSGTQKLSDYSEWLADQYRYFEYKEYIEIPGQYEDDIEPYVENHVKIAGFKKNILSLSSIRKPKKLTINGSNEKQYDLLVKGGEDLRLDQRIQQVFKVMNKCFEDDPNCHNRQLKISTFQVVPITNRAGVIEWVNVNNLKTLPLKEIIENNLEDGSRVSNCRSVMAMIDWLDSLFPDVNDMQEKHALALGVEGESVIKAYTKAASRFPK